MARLYDTPLTTVLTSPGGLRVFGFQFSLEGPKNDSISVIFSLFLRVKFVLFLQAEMKKKRIVKHVKFEAGDV